MHVRVSRSGLAAHDPRAFSLCVVDAMPYARIFLPNTRCGGARILLICRYPAVGAFPFRVFPNGHHIPGCVSAGQAGTTPRPRGPEAVRTAPGPSTSASSSPFDPRSTPGGGGPTLRHGAGPPPCPSGCRYTTVGQSVSTEGRGDLGRRVQEVRSPQKVHNGEARAVEAVRDLTFERGEGEPGRPVGPFGCHRGARRKASCPPWRRRRPRRPISGVDPTRTLRWSVRWHIPPWSEREEPLPGRSCHRCPSPGMRAQGWSSESTSRNTCVCCITEDSPCPEGIGEVDARSVPPAESPRNDCAHGSCVRREAPTGTVGAKTPQQSQEHLHAQGGREGKLRAIRPFSARVLWGSLQVWRQRPPGPGRTYSVSHVLHRGHARLPWWSCRCPAQGGLVRSRVSAAWVRCSMSATATVRGRRGRGLLATCSCVSAGINVRPCIGRGEGILPSVDV